MGKGIGGLDTFSPAPFRVLIAEDDALTRRDLAERVRDDMHPVRLAEDGEQGILAFEDFRPDIVLTDVQMPGRSGLELARYVKARSPEAFVVLITAFCDRKTLLAALDIGVDKFVTKPLDSAQLDQTMDAAEAAVTRQRNQRRKSLLLDQMLDHNPDFFLTTDGSHVYYLNRPFLDYLGIDNLGGEPAPLDLVNSRIKRSTLDPEAGSGNWIGAVLRDPGREHILALEACPGQEPPRTFLVRVGHVPMEEQTFSVITFSDITRIEREKDFYLELAHKDPLTGIANRKRFQEEARREIYRAARYASRLSLIMLDIDDFKRVNDSHGHQVGDFVLTELAGLMVAAIRRSDLFARYGGEEFLLLAPETGLDRATMLAQKLRAVIEGHDFDVAGRITASFGVAEFMPALDYDAFVRAADTALYRAKALGKNQVYALAPGR